MRWKSIGVLLILFLGLGTFYYVYEIRQGPAREKATAEKDRLWKGLEWKDVEEVTITRGAETLRLKKSGDAWALAAPVEAKAEARAAEDLATALAMLRVEREVDPSPAKPADFGLDPPAAEVLFRAKGEEHRIRLGAKNPTGTWVYAQAGTKPAVLLVPDSLLREAQKKPSDFRDKTVLAFEAKDVKGLEVTPRQGPTVTAELKGPDDWRLTAPVAVAADREQVGALLESLRSARIKEFVTESPKTPAEYGLDRPVRLVLWLGEEKERASRALRFGAVVPDRQAVYAQREGEPGVFLVEEGFFKTLPLSVTGLRDKTVLAFDRAKVERVELESPKGKLALAFADSAWRLTAPAPLAADETAVSQLIWKTRDLKAREFLAGDATRLKEYGLDRPQLRLSVWEKDAPEPKTLLLGPAKEKDLAYAAVVGAGAGPGPVMLVEGRFLDELARSPQDLRDRAMFAKFEPRDVARIQIERPGQTLVLERTGEEEWRLTTPRRGQAQGPRVNDLVWSLRTLKWRDLVAEQGWEAARYGLEPPATTLTLAGKDGKALATLAVGRREKDDLYVRVPGQPQLYLIEAKGLGQLPAAAEDVLL
jgi:hypothetical protein